jgi:hypothetical protein
LVEVFKKIMAGTALKRNGGKPDGAGSKQLQF